MIGTIAVRNLITNVAAVVVGIVDVEIATIRNVILADLIVVMTAVTAVADIAGQPDARTALLQNASDAEERLAKPVQGDITAIASSGVQSVIPADPIYVMCAAPPDAQAVGRRVAKAVVPPAVSNAGMLGVILVVMGVRVKIMTNPIFVPIAGRSYVRTA